MKTISKILSVVLCLAMVVGFFVVGAAAANTKVTSIAVGDTIIFKSIAGTKAMGTQHNNNYRIAVDDEAQAVKFTVEEGSVANSFSFKDPEGNYLAWYGSDSSNNKLYNKTTKDDTSSWTVEFDASGNATISNVGKPARLLQFNNNNNQWRFAAYTGSQQKVTIYKVGGEACTHEGKTHSTKRDAAQHWTVCECGAMIGEKANHTFTNGVCSCGFINHVAEPAVGKTYKLGLYQGTLDKFLYITGVQSGSYLATTENAAEAADVFVETVEGGWRFFVVVENVKTYIDVVPTYNESKEKWYYNATLVTEPTCTWTWNEEHDTFVTVMTEGYTEATEHYVGTYSDFNTLSSSKLSYAATSFPSHLYAAADHTHTLGDAVNGTTGHYQTCSICGYKTTETAHADANNDQKCDACGTNVACTHSWKAMTSDAKHWEECEKCHEKKGEADHTFTKKTSDAKHWEECTCGLKKGEAEHTFTEGKCTCGATDPNYKAPEKNEPVIDTGVKDPKVGSSFKLGMYQENLKSYLYFNGKLDSKGYYLATTDKYSEAVDVIVEAATGGYYLYFMDGTTKTYVDLYVTDTGYVNLRLAAAPSAVYTWNSEYKTFTTDLVVGDKAAEPYYIGTYNEYKTFSGSKLSYAATSFPSHLYADEPAATGDNSVVSVAIAALLVSAMGVTALVMKKKSF